MYYNYSDLNYINQELNGVWPGWFAVRLLGRGAFGAVYEIQRNVRGNLEKAAMKVLRVPDSDAEIARIQFQGMTWQNTEEYYEQYVDSIHNEIRIMQSFVGNSHIVSYEDYSIRKRYNQIGWDLYIRMELLAGLPDYMKTHSFDEKMTVRLGMDIAQGLRDCHNAGIIHRDVKPENIFVNKVGNFKLGDFGISRNAPGSHDVLSFKGTLAYMAPEVYRMLSTDARSDIYSLGMVLYQCLNDNRLPFVPSKFSPFDIETARQRRFAGEPIPAPAHGSRALKNIVLRALEEKPEDRFQTAEELYFELMEVYRTDYGTGRRSAGSASRIGRNEYSRDYNYDKSAERKAEYGARETVLLEDVSPVESNLIAEEEPSGKSGRVEEESLVEITLKEEVEPLAENNRVEEESLVESSLKEEMKRPAESNLKEVVEPPAESNVKEVVEPSAEVTCEEEPEEVSKAASDDSSVQMSQYIMELHIEETRENDAGAVDEQNDESEEQEVTDFVIDWKDSALEAKMRKITGILYRDIMYSDVKDITNLKLSSSIVIDRINDISALGNLTSLKSLELNNNQIRDISALRNLKNLTNLYLKDNQIRDISALSGLTNLIVLDLSWNQISYISALRNLKNLTNLKLTDNQIRNIGVLSELTNLIDLDLSWNQISYINALSNLLNLTNLNLTYNQIIDISALSGLTNLEYLSISDNPIKNYSPIEKLEIKNLQR